MINSMQLAIIRKDIRGITVNRNMFLSLLILPLIFAVFFPSIMVMILVFAPTDLNDYQVLLQLLPVDQQLDSTTRMIIKLMMDQMFPVFLTMIPIMSASVMGASAFVGEKEKRTLETLLYSPLSVRQIFQAKVLACLTLSMFVTLLSYLVMLIVLQVEIVLTTGSALMPGVSWIIVPLLISPAVALIAITLIVSGSAKAKTMEESQQKAAFLVMPIAALMAAQFSGLIMINVWTLLIIGIILAVTGVTLILRATRKFTYELLLD